ncbi:hypothetical protein NIES4075_15290 [Tolypothrix sp. NIES-4075]|uniref:hypothetical protein n=1 Tax=Tolypothrix sp. NIES-4075 TaxID=2005459 RepID=UPI000B765204|nr:hypothetical protein [Tolypothrix sp. NIES-4075]GAX40563.1 hypothetical protein NIES4075_15290 [Tolypothrix sp. NIES-4075]
MNQSWQLARGINSLFTTTETVINKIPAVVNTTEAVVMNGEAVVTTTETVINKI